MPVKTQRHPIATRTRVLGGLMAFGILLLSLAGVSPALHDWMHADSGCASACDSHSEERDENEGHYCGVIALQSALNTVATVALPERIAHQRIDLEATFERYTTLHIDRRLRARAPPVEIIV